MKRIKTMIYTAAALLALSALPATALADELNLSWYSVDGGGGTSSGGGLELSGTIGQPDASNGSTGGTFELTGGFWSWVDPGESCEGDINRNHAVEIGDLLQLLSAWGACSECCPEDLDHDGLVSVVDLLTLLAHWGPCP